MNLLRLKIVCGVAIAVAICFCSGVTFATQILIAPTAATPATANPSSLPPALQWLAAKTPGNMPCVVWANIAGQTNSQPAIYTAYNYPTNFVRNTNCLIFNATGSTAIFQGYTHSNGTYATPGVLLTRRIFCIRGHSNGDVNLGINQHDNTGKIYFVDRTNGIYCGTITNALAAR